MKNYLDYYKELLAEKPLTNLCMEISGAMDGNAGDNILGLPSDPKNYYMRMLPHDFPTFTCEYKPKETDAVNASLYAFKMLKSRNEPASFKNPLVIDKKISKESYLSSQKQIENLREFSMKNLIPITLGHAKKQGRWLTNTYDIDQPDARTRYAFSEEKWKEHVAYVNKNIRGLPQATDYFTVEKLQEMGLIGIYAPIEENDINFSVEGKLHMASRNGITGTGDTREAAKNDLYESEARIVKIWNPAA